MAYNILIIDDEWRHRRESYQNLAQNICSHQFDVSFEYLETGTRPSLTAQLHQGNYSAIISDAILNIQWHDFTIQDVVDIVREFNDNIPMAVLSGRWGDDNINQVRHAFSLPNCRTFLHWRDIGKDGGGDIGYAVESIMHMVASSQGLDTNLRLEPGEDLRIVHVSDLHVQRVANEEDNDTFQRLRNDALTSAQTIRAHWQDKPPAFVVFTGDVTEYGDPDQYKYAQKWIEYFCARLKFGQLPSRRLLYVPGNHDVNLKLASAARINLNIQDESINPEIGDPENESLLAYASVPFRNYLSKLTDCPLFFDDIDTRKFAWLETRFRHYGVVFYGVNTSELSSSELPKRKVDLELINLIGERLTEISRNSNDPTEHPPIVFGLGHHSPLSVDDHYGAVANTREMKSFFQGVGKTHIFLHGHGHENRLELRQLENSNIILSGAPSFGAQARNRPEDTFRGFNLLTLTRKINSIKGLKIQSFGWNAGEINALHSKEYTLKNYNFQLLENVEQCN